MVKPKHVGAFVVNLNVNFNILKEFNFALVGQIKDLITSKCTVHLKKKSLCKLLIYLCFFNEAVRSRAVSTASNGTFTAFPLKNIFYLMYFFKEIQECWSQWPCGLRRRCAATRLLRSWVRIPPGAWMFVVSVVCCEVEVSATS